ncbi:acetoin dehydrogenase E2 subunit dihydrolipoyllysine-residue acetyltransferase [Streptomyces sp. MP131-18]|nr:alpha/beta fold hydrolase [Streptomyces sp. MP131-18]ONK09384.1 acetoin dehydrogenase E2 subunit dihydrolipoyllysine-residue acetyltransferase [Streptomyces sp. MP131-18]
MHPILTPAAVDSGTPPDAAGPPLLLVHGWGGDGGDRAPLMPLLGPHRRLLVPDLPGHGGTPRRTTGAPRGTSRPIWPGG